MDGMPNTENKSGVKTTLEWGSGGIFLGIGFLALLFIVLNYFNIVSLPRKSPPPTAIQPTPTPASISPEKTITLPFAPTDPLVNSTSVVYVIKGKVNKIEKVEKDGKTVYNLEIWSPQGQTSYTFGVPEAKLAVNQKNAAGEYVGPGDDIFLVVSYDPKKPDNLIYGSAQVTHLLK